MSLKEKGLLTSLKAGHPQAVRAWYRAYANRLLRLARTRVSNPKDAEEIVQDTFISCLKHLPLFRGESSIYTWMTRILHHEIADYYRRRYAKRAINTVPLLDQLLVLPPKNMTATSQAVSHALAQLTPAYRELLLQKYIDNKRVRQIATDLGRTVKAVESDLYRARLEFKTAYLSICSS